MEFSSIDDPLIRQTKNMHLESIVRGQMAYVRFGSIATKTVQAGDRSMSDARQKRTATSLPGRLHSAHAALENRCERVRTGVRFWHKADISSQIRDVRFRGHRDMMLQVCCCIGRPLDDLCLTHTQLVRVCKSDIR
jgi:hypothetical protein